jgi:two-component system, LytTR family, response regulator
MKIVTVIIDDDEDSRLITGGFIRKYHPDFEIAGEAGTVEAGFALVESARPALLLLDIEMPDGTGFDLLQRLSRRDFEVIFITAFNAYAIDAFRFSAIDYLLKPVSLTDLKESLLRVKEKLQNRFFEEQWKNLSHNREKKNSYDRKIAIGSHNGYVFVQVKDIVRCESESNYTRFYFGDGTKMISSRTLGFYEEMLPADKFFRIHNSHLVNIDFLTQYKKDGRGGTVIMKDGVELDVSHRKKAEFLQKILPGQDAED